MGKVKAQYMEQMEREGLSQEDNSLDPVGCKKCGNATVNADDICDECRAKSIQNINGIFGELKQMVDTPIWETYTPKEAA